VSGGEYGDRDGYGSGETAQRQGDEQPRADQCQDKFHAAKMTSGRSL
jgi:hypothetical protein